MRLARWAEGVGYVEGDVVIPCAGTIVELARHATVEPGWLPQPTGDPVPLSSVRLQAPVDPPGSVRDFYAFERHVATARASRGLEMEPGWYRLPVFYFSNAGALLGHGDEVSPPARTNELDFELELAWIVGEDVHGADVEAAGRAVVGYTVMNDWSARDIQREEMKLSLGPAKGKDFATSLGPVLVTADEFDAAGGAMRAWVNGRQVSEADVGECHWSIAEMTAYAAESTVVRAGDVFGTGTCGTGCLLELSLTHGSEAYPWLKPGDEVVLEIEGIGRLANRVAAEPGGPAWEPES